MNQFCFSLQLSLIALIVLAGNGLTAQTPFNIKVTDSEVDAVLRGLYDPADYASTVVEDDVNEVVCALEQGISTDTLLNIIKTLQNFQTRNTYSDTLSAARGIGAARRWVFQRLRSFSSQAENRLLVSYMELEMPETAECGAGVFRNVFGVLPGRDTTDPTVMILEGHLDSRCEELCDTACFAPGAEDNASGCALVLELARVMSPYTYDHSIVFLLTIGEEQGLFGAEAFANYCSSNDIGVKAVQNNDITGGVICGPSSSPPSCPGDGDRDSTSVRIFSSGVINSIHKDYARFMKTVYREKVSGITDVPMAVRLISQEDRSGRGGDHIPFRENGFRAIRVCAANEHGDANTSSASYTGRQHSFRDIIGVDTNDDLEPDSFFVDFHYLKRNAVFNGASLAAAALGPDAPGFTVADDGLTVRVEINDPANWNRYRIGVRQFGNDFEALYEIAGSTSFDLPGIEPANTYRVTVAAIDDAGVQSLFAPEISFFASANTLSLPADTALLSPMVCLALGFDFPFIGTSPSGQNENRWLGVELRPARPNPTTDKTIFTVTSQRRETFAEATLQLHDSGGRLVWSHPFVLTAGEYSVTPDLMLASGTYALSLHIGGELVQSRGLVSASGN